ncbi:DNA binding protein [Mycobacterium phage Lakes]|uniref:Gene 53 protein n=3 Tax=Mycobacterium phage D29 TaxID=28369 RepID=VG53_BPMD2|nr:sigma-K factor [Mycobacterium phage D29]O64243.1 RecName: Full=Gene 53 protein; AltName: Full=Gp53 [Fromanvirus D29]AAC18493.1 DNA binding protein [Mycobacterium phage D29]QFG08818.1 RNA polymerase sigma factor [Mycobacterium phage Naji]QUE26009.1 DNA binding protein [Mycobacterium phage Lakes]
MTGDINKLFMRATRKAMIGWETNLTADEIVQELWVWYLESPYIQKKLGELRPGEAVIYVRKQVHNILSGSAKARDLFQERSHYSSDNVKDALRGESTNRYLVDILPLAMKELGSKNERHAEAIRVRYDDGVVPERGSAAEAMLKRAVKSLTEHVNIIAITAGVERDDNGKVIVKDGPGSKHAIFPDIRKVQGEGHSDPTANIAIMLVEHPGLRDEYLYEPPIPEFLGGRCYAKSA